MAKKPSPSDIVYKDVQTPYDQTQEETGTQENTVLDSPDIQAFRAFNPDFNLLDAATDAQFEHARQGITDSYGANTGIPSAVLRNRLRDEGLADLEGKRATALASGSAEEQAMKMQQLEAIANLTKSTRSTTSNKTHGYGYNTQIVQPQAKGGGTGNAALGAAATVGVGILTA